MENEHEVSQFLIRKQAFFHLCFEIQNLGQLEPIKGRQGKIIAAAKTILIDEVTMVGLISCRQ